jgi:6-phosphogluconolactonase
MSSYTGTKRSLASRRSFMVAAAAAVALIGGLASEATMAHESAGAVYVPSNQTTGNSILVYDRSAEGVLTFTGSFPTGGAGTGTGADPLGSQNSLVYSSGFLFAINAGSNDVSMLEVDGDRLILSDRVSSGGQMPVSVAVHGPLVYVVNAGGTPNISGFIVDPFRHHLLPLPKSQRPLAGGAAAAPAEVAFSADGRSLLVTEKGTQTIDTYHLSLLGYASNPTSNPSSGVTPFGFSVTRRGYAIVSEAGTGAASSYDIEEDGKLALVSGSVLLSQTAPCWLVTTGDGRFAYTANAGSGTIGSFRIAADGELTLISGAAGVIAAPLDLGITADSRFVYVREGNGSVSGFRVERDGSLGFVNSAAGIPAGAQGIAVR